MTDREWFVQVANIQLRCIWEMIRTRRDPDMPLVALRVAEKELDILRREK